MTESQDWTRFNAYLLRHVPESAGPVEIEAIAGGQSNPTWFVTAGARRLVLRKQPPGELLPSAHAIDREYRIMGALAGTGVPVPRLAGYCEDRTILGTPFYLMERVEGRIFRTAEMAGVEPEARRAMYLAATDAMARLHRIDWPALGLEDFGRKGNYFNRQYARWSRQWTASKRREIPAIDRLIEWLPGHMPDDDRTAICHGDYRIGNLLFDPTGPDVVAVLDWELSTLGHPLADLGFFCIPFHTLASEYGGVMDLDLGALGIPRPHEIVERYEAAYGEPVTLKPFHVVFALFRFAVIFAGIEARAAQNDPAGIPAELRRTTDALAMRGAALAGC